MKIEEWNSMTKRQQADYLNANKIRVIEKSFLDGSSWVGEARVTVKRKAICGGVGLTDWLDQGRKEALVAGQDVKDGLVHAAASWDLSQTEAAQ